MLLILSATRDPYEHAPEGVEEGDLEDCSSQSSGYLSPWSDEGSDHNNGARINPIRKVPMKVPTTINDEEFAFGSHRIKTPTLPLSEAMEGAETILKRLVRLGFRIRQSAITEWFRRADATFDAAGHEGFRKHLISMLFVKQGRNESLNKSHVSATDSDRKDGLSKAQIRLIDSNLKRRNRFIYARDHAENLVPRQPSIVQETVARSRYVSSEILGAWTSQQSITEQGSRASSMMLMPVINKESSRVSDVSGKGSQSLEVAREQIESDQTALTSTVPETVDLPSVLTATEPEISSFRCPYCAQLVSQNIGKSPHHWK